MSKKKFKIIKLNFTSPLNISRGKPDFYDKTETFIRSDTLKSAIFSAALVHKDINADEKFFDSFFVSTTYPFYQDDQALFFMPRPVMPGFEISKRFTVYDEQGKKKDEFDYAKDLKKAKYFYLELWEKFINGQKQELSENQFSGSFILPKVNNKQASNDSRCSDKENKSQSLVLMKTAEQDRVYIYRMEEIINKKKPKFTEPYRIDRLYFHQNAGLYFFIETTDDETYKKVLKALDLLQDFGVGTDRNVGNGQFKYEESSLEIDLPDDFTYLLNLGLYLPQKEEASNAFTEDAYYSLIERGGHISNLVDVDYLTLIKRPINMIEEASVLSAFTDEKINGFFFAGKKVDVRPYDAFPHPVWRDGRSLFIPVKL